MTTYPLDFFYLSNKCNLGEAPVGKPHAGAVREEDIELVDAQFDKDGNVVTGSSGFAGIPDNDERTQDEIDADNVEDEDEEDEPKSKKKKEMMFQKASN